MFFPAPVSRAFHRADDIVRGRGVWRLYGFLRQTQWWSLDRLEQLQLRKLKTLLRHAAEHSPYYRDAFARTGIRADNVEGLHDLYALPVLTREILREQKDRIRSEGVPPARLRPNSTGGSTGSNVRFWVDLDCWRWRDAVDLRMWEVMGLHAGVPAVYVWGSPMDETRARRVRNRLRMLLDNGRHVSAYRAGDEDLTALAAYLERARPRALIGYASVLDALASNLRRKQRRLSLPGLTVVSSAEVLFPEQRRNIAEVLQAKVLDLYGCREFGLVALECAEGGVRHLMEERFIVETVPSVDAGASSLRITDLDNRGFPLIRYEIGDLGRLEPSACPCGRRHRVLAGLEGRTFDLVRSPSGKAVGGTFWSLLLRTAVSGVETWQVVQTRPDHLEIRVTPLGALSEASRARIYAEVTRMLGEEMKLDIVERDSLDRLASGKHRFVVAEPIASARDGAPT